METVLILGVGVADSVGGALARRFAREGLHVVVGGRTPERLQQTVDAVRSAGGSAEAFAVDVTSQEQVNAAFEHLRALGQPVASVIYNAGSNSIIPFEELSAEQFTQFWAVCCLGGFHTAKLAMPLLRDQGRGSMLFTGSSGSLRGKPNFAHFAAAKAGVRNLAQALAREFGPQGVHVAHIVIDGVVRGERVRQAFPGYLEHLGEDGSLHPDAIADAYWSVHTQHRSAWSFEVDLRPFRENW